MNSKLFKIPFFLIMVSLPFTGAEAGTASSPKDLDTCFSPEEACDQKLLAFVETASSSIDIAIYDLNLDQIGHALLTLSRTRKIKVRILVDRRQAKGRHSIVPMLIKAGADIRFGYQRGIMHNKFTIVDGKMLETGSFNYTNHAARANNENQIYLSNPKIVKAYQARFEIIWKKGKAPASDLGESEAGA